MTFSNDVVFADSSSLKCILSASHSTTGTETAFPIAVYLKVSIFSLVPLDSGRVQLSGKPCKRSDSNGDSLRTPFSQTT